MIETDQPPAGADGGLLESRGPERASLGETTRGADPKERRRGGTMFRAKWAPGSEHTSASRSRTRAEDLSSCEQGCYPLWRDQTPAQGCLCRCDSRSQGSLTGIAGGRARGEEGEGGSPAGTAGHTLAVLLEQVPQPA